MYYKVVLGKRLSLIGNMKSLAPTEEINYSYSLVFWLKLFPLGYRMFYIQEVLY